MFEDSYLDSFMEGHIGNWTGDEDRYYDQQWTGDPNYDEDLLLEQAREQEEYYGEDEEMDEYDSDPEYDNYDDPNDY